MKIHSIKIKNFRSYKDEVKIELNDLIALVGKNDIGKSTILEALDIFFNDGNGVVKIDKTDVNVLDSSLLQKWHMKMHLSIRKSTRCHLH